MDYRHPGEYSLLFSPRLSPIPRVDRWMIDSTRPVTDEASLRALFRLRFSCRNRGDFFIVIGDFGFLILVMLEFNSSIGFCGNRVVFDSVYFGVSKEFI